MAILAAAGRIVQSGRGRPVALRTMRKALVVALFLLSGAAALAYQVSWTRHLVLVFGNTTRAVALILAAYMLGLALGSEFGGRLADRAKRPVLLYAIFEAAIGIFALAFPPLVGGVRSTYISLGTDAFPVLFGGAFLVLLVPTFLMGTTLPLLVRTVVRDPAKTGGDVGLLYGMNIVGAVIGTAITGFWLIEHAGVLGATRYAAALNVLIALLALAVPRLPTRSPPTPAAPVVSEKETVEVAVPPGSLRASKAAQSSTTARAAMIAAFGGGLVGLAAEVVWTRLLVFFLQGFTYTFTAMLAVFLSGLALGGFVFGRVALRTKRPALLAGRLQLLLGVASAAAFLVLANHYPLTKGVFRFVGESLGIETLRPRHITSLLLASATVLIVPTFLMGGVLPLAAAAYQRGLADLGTRIGRLYAANTIGAVLGALIAGFLLAPLAGPAWAAVWVALAAVGTGALVVFTVDGVRRTALPVAAAVVATVVLLALAEPSRPFLTRSHVFLGARGREHTLLDSREGVVCQVSVVENEREGFRLLYTDEFQAAGTRPEYRYMRMLAHLPVAMTDDPTRVLVVCYGTGTTCASAATHPEVRELDIVEISPEVIDVASYFGHVNNNVLSGAGRDDLTVRVHVDDGRNFVLRSKEQWGVISLEPLMPYTPAAIHFYTEDFYRECRPRLTEGGMMCQWIPLHGLSRAHLRQLVSAFVNVFPGAAMFHVEGAVALIGGKSPVTLDHGAIASRLAAPPVVADLSAAGFADPVRALATVVSTGDALDEFGAVEPMTDEHPWLEFHPIPAGVQPKHLWENLGAMRELREAYVRLPVERNAQLDARYETARDVGNLILEAQHLLEEAGLLQRLKQTDGALTSLRGAREALHHATAIDPVDPAARRGYESVERTWRTMSADAYIQAGDLPAAERELKRALGYRTETQRDVVPTLLATVLNRREEFLDALSHATEATMLYPRGRDALAERAYARAALGDMAGAAADYRRALGDDDPEVLGARLAGDARRALDAAPGDDEATLTERIETALGGQRLARIPATHVLRLLRADHPDGFSTHFADDIAVLAADAPDPGAKMAALKRVWIAAPHGAGDAALQVARDPQASQSLGRAATEAFAELAPGRIDELLDATLPVHVLATAARAAGGSPSMRPGPALLDLLEHEDAAVRDGARRGLYSLTGGRPDALAVLDTTAWPSESYSDAVFAIREWWQRAYEMGAPPE